MSAKVVLFIVYTGLIAGLSSFCTYSYLTDNKSSKTVVTSLNVPTVEYKSPPIELEKPKTKEPVTLPVLKKRKQNKEVPVNIPPIIDTVYVNLTPRGEISFHQDYPFNVNNEGSNSSGVASIGGTIRAYSSADTLFIAPELKFTIRDLKLSYVPAVEYRESKMVFSFSPLLGAKWEQDNVIPTIGARLGIGDLWETGVLYGRNNGNDSYAAFVGARMIKW